MMDRITGSRLWGVLFAAGVAYEAYVLRASRNDDTLSQITRKTFGVDTSKAGRAIFVAAHIGITGWYMGHILRWWR